MYIGRLTDKKDRANNMKKEDDRPAIKAIVTDNNLTRPA